MCLEIGLGARHKEAAHFVEPMKPFEVDVATSTVLLVHTAPQPGTLPGTRDRFKTGLEHGVELRQYGGCCTNPAGKSQLSFK